MVAAISVLFVLAMAYSQYKQADRNGQWSWMGFFAVLGAMVAFLAAFIIPVVNSTLLQAHPGWMMAVLLSGILVFVSALILACRRYYGRFFPVKGASASPSETARNSKSVIPAVAIAVDEDTAG